ncbi:MAG: putative serine protease HtrA [Microgenomates bacterium OLB23]|nr:MAG: putative serine protease HtrA [Microgenomates bacterium OLB23]
MRRLLALILIIGFGYWGYKNGYFKDAAPYFNKPSTVTLQEGKEKITVLTEESAIIQAIDKALPSVVTVSITQTQSQRGFQINPFDPFGSLRRQQEAPETVDRNIGSGFAIGEDLVVTNKHVVGNTDAEYHVIANDTTYTVTQISRDPLNDLAILRINKKALKAITLGNSDNLKLGQIVIAIGTPLGEFTNTVTTGIISGLGRGITAGSPFEGFVERLDNVIQTDAAINPGNSGGPLLNSQGEVIGINTAVSSESQNIGFAIPVNVVRELVENFNAGGGKILRPFIGVRYQMVSRQAAILNSVPEGAFIVEVVKNSPAQKADIQPEDIITDFDGQKVRGNDEETLQKLIAKKKVGDKIEVKLWRNGTLLNKTLVLDTFE